VQVAAARQLLDLRERLAAITRHNGSLVIMFSVFSAMIPASTTMRALQGVHFFYSHGLGASSLDLVKFIPQRASL